MSETNIQIRAINPKYQSQVNRFIKHNARYSQIVDETDDNGGAKQQRAYDNGCNALDGLPKRELANIRKKIDITGYFY